ncbi:MAG: GGDEF domain-containing protein [Desulfovibrio sp.]|nr:GGDEF domain-containing protein [Desulfovibrio sp.]
MQVVMQYNDRQNLERILQLFLIKTVYQPIVSLTDGSIFGYEALSRISNNEININIEELFRIADKMNKSWELETLCRTKSLENCMRIGEKKLFINVNPNIIYDNRFKKGFTKNILNAYGFGADNIIFEITEHSAVVDNNAFLTSLNHYKSQNYGIAIDDVGSGYSGLNVITNVRPDFIKLDMSLIRNIDKDETKRALCKAMIDFGKNAGIKLIAEGIETEEELSTLIKLDISFGQGFFLGIPQESFEDIAPEKVKIITKCRAKNYIKNIRSSVYPIVGHISKPGYTFPSNKNADSIYEVLRLNPTITDFSIVDEGVTVGVMTRTELNERFSGRYGYSLHSKKNIRQLMNPDFLKVNYNMPVEQVSRLAMQRPYEQLYKPIVVEEEMKYFGMVTIKDLLDACTKVEVDIARHSNPLTGLPGNLLIEKEILSRIFRDRPYCITYYDIDNFKAYNDAYGFDNGDRMLSLVADILKDCAVKDEFIGHIGGDDFIVICDYHEGEDYCESVINQFSSRVTSLYRDEDLKNGHIISKNRQGVTELFPIASLSIAGLSNKTNTYKDIDSFSKDIAQLKKKCKRQVGNYFEVI